MRLSVLAFAALVAGCATQASPNSAWVDGLTFRPMLPPNASGSFAATLDGSMTKAAPYTLRIHLTKGGKIFPHTHPDPRYITVVDGNLCYGFGETFDPDACTDYPEGSSFLVPANAPHYGYGKEDAVYQESGMGPSAFVLPEKD